MCENRRGTAASARSWVEAAAGRHAEVEKQQGSRLGEQYPARCGLHFLLRRDTGREGHIVAPGARSPCCSMWDCHQRSVFSF